MKRRRLAVIAAIAVVLVLGIGAVVWERSRADHAGHAHADAEQSSVYYCPMHPTVTSDEADNCPICGMKLVKRTPAQSSDVATQLADSAKTTPGLASVSLSPAQQVMANVRTAVVGSSESSSEFVTTGRVTADERRVTQVTSYTAGRIERLYVNFTGDTVSRGEAVASIYSPDLYATQQEYLLALENRRRMQSSGFAQARTAADDLVDSTRRRLQLFGMTSSQIDRLASGGRPFFTTTIVSPVSGIVTQKLVVAQQYVAQGEPLLELTDLSVVWVEADVYEQNLSSVAIGQRVAVTTPAIPGVTLTGEVSFVQPVVAGDTRTTRVRIELPNENKQLKPEMFVNVRIAGSTARPVLTVPASAIVDRGQQQLVWVEAGAGRYMPRAVTTGARTGDRVEIVAGLSRGEKVVVEGGFLLDSEAQLRTAVGQ